MAIQKTNRSTIYGAYDAYVDISQRRIYIFLVVCALVYVVVRRTYRIRKTRTTTHRLVVRYVRYSYYGRYKNLSYFSYTHARL